MNAVRRLVNPILFAIVFSAVGWLVGGEALYFRAAVFLFAALYWGVVAGIVVSSVFCATYCFAGDITPLSLAAMMGAVPASPFAVLALRRTFSSRLFALAVGLLHTGLLGFLYVFHVRTLPKVMILPLALALFCFLYYLVKVPNLRVILRAGLFALGINYLVIIAVALALGVAPDGSVEGAAPSAASTLFRIIPADLLVLLILSYLLPTLRAMFKPDEEEPP